MILSVPITSCLHAVLLFLAKKDPRRYYGAKLMCIILEGRFGRTTDSDSDTDGLDVEDDETSIGGGVAGDAGNGGTASAAGAKDDGRQEAVYTLTKEGQRVEALEVDRQHQQRHHGREKQGDDDEAKGAEQMLQRSDLFRTH